MIKKITLIIFIFCLVACGASKKCCAQTFEVKGYEYNINDIIK